MYTVVSDENEIKAYQKKFFDILSANTVIIPSCKPECPGNHLGDAYWSPNLAFWVFFDVNKTRTANRYWNAFGLEKPTTNCRIPITAEICFSFCGKNNVEGAFAKNEQGEVAVMHRGRFNNSGHVIKREDFLSRTRRQVITIKESKRDISVAFIGKLRAPDFPAQVRDFIHEIHELKKFDLKEQKDE